MNTLRNFGFCPWYECFGGKFVQRVRIYVDVYGCALVALGAVLWFVLRFEFDYRCNSVRWFTYSCGILLLYNGGIICDCLCVLCFMLLGWLL